MVVQRAIASSIGRLLEYSHLRAIELAFNSWCDAIRAPMTVLRTGRWLPWFSSRQPSRSLIRRRFAMTKAEITAWEVCVHGKDRFAVARRAVAAGGVLRLRPAA